MRPSTLPATTEGRAGSAPVKRRFIARSANGAVMGWSSSVFRLARVFFRGLLLPDDSCTAFGLCEHPLSVRAAMTQAAESPYKGETGLKRILSATRNSIAGFQEAVRCED